MYIYIYREREKRGAFARSDRRAPGGWGAHRHASRTPPAPVVAPRGRAAACSPNQEEIRCTIQKNMFSVCPPRVFLLFSMCVCSPCFGPGWASPGPGVAGNGFPVRCFFKWADSQPRSCLQGPFRGDFMFRIPKTRFVKKATPPIPKPVFGWPENSICSWYGLWAASSKQIYKASGKFSMGPELRRP